MEQEIYKIRSTSACIKAAYTLFSSNTKTIFRRLWIPALVFALIMAAATVVGSLASRAVVEHPQTVLAYSMLSSSLKVASVFAMIWLIAALFTMLDKFPLKRNILQASKATILHLAISIGILLVAAIPIIVTIPAIVAAIPAQPHTGAELSSGEAFNAITTALSTKSPNGYPMLPGAIAIGAVIYIVLSLVILPIYYFYVKYMMEPIHMRSHLWKSFKTGMRHWGFLFATVFMTSLLLLCFCLVLFMPLGILDMALTHSLTGMLMGDPSGLPGHMFFLQFITALFSYFLFLFFIVYSILVLYYAYGSIEQKESERKAMASTKNSQPDSSHAANSGLVELPSATQTSNLSNS